ncbi:MAG: pirin family protein [Bdellovibrio sp.]
MSTKVFDIDFQWPVQEPFLFCVHHNDRYPPGNENLGLDASHFRGRQVGSDFILKNGFRLYHGREIPGFPVHPHRGFETITIVRKGYIDHADSLGAAGRYGQGDVQWMTAGAGVQHSEMFPLLHKNQENVVELFQIWLNLPKKNKMVQPDFKMLWNYELPKIINDGVEVTLISGEYQEHRYYEAPKNSWASDPNNSVNILLVKMEAEKKFRFPPGKVATNRTIYFFEGNEVLLNGQSLKGKKAVYLNATDEISVHSKDISEFLILEARPIGEPIVQHGPFVMNTREEIFQTFQDYQQTQFGGWSWPRQDMIHGEKIERFAKYLNGQFQRPENEVE